MTNIVRCAEYLKCKEMISQGWNPEIDCEHWVPHEAISECYPSGFCETIGADADCLPESVEEIDDELAGLIESANNLGRELVAMATTAPALRDASDRMWSILQDLDAYFDKLAADEDMEEMWEEAGMQSEGDAEYG